MTSLDFYSCLAVYYDRIFPLKKDVVSFVAGFLKKPGGLVLDIGCATGQLAIALAEMGWNVKAFDLDENMIRVAKEKITDKKNPEFFIGDMNQLKNYAKYDLFDAVICFGNTLPHLKEKGAIRSFFQNAYSVLKPGGWLMIQIVNLAKTGAEYVFPVIQNELFCFERRYRENSGTPSSILFHSRLTTPNNTFKNTVALQPLSHTVIESWLDEATFGKRYYFGDFLRLPYQPDSPALIVCAQKKPEE